VERNKINPELSNYKLAKDIKNATIPDLFFIVNLIDLHAIFAKEDHNVRLTYLDTRSNVVNNMKDKFCKDGNKDDG
jgi:hypothetical protein